MKQLEVGIAAAIGVASSLYLTYVIGKFLKNKKKKWVEVGRVKSLYIYPIKSFKNIPLTSAEVTHLGLKSGEYKDRHFIVINNEGKFLTAREYPKLVLIQPNINEGVLQLAMENQPLSPMVNLDEVIKNDKNVSINLWYDVPMEALDCGDEIGNWICNALSEPVGSLKLLYFIENPKHERGVHHDERYTKLGGKRTDKIAFPDVVPVSLQTQPSLDDLNSRLTDKRVQILNFRPNIVVTGNSPFDEDNWTEVRIGDKVKLTYVIPCTRCVLTTVNPDTGEKDPKSEPLRTLRTYRQVDPSLKEIFKYSGPVFGANLAVDQPGVIHVGDKVYAVYK